MTLFASAAISPAQTAAPGTPAQPVPAPSAHQFTIATQKIERFSSLSMAPEAYAGRLAKISLAVRNILLMPDVLGLQGIDNPQTLQDLAAQISADAIAAGQTDPGYAVCVDTGSNIPTGTAFLYSQARMDITSCAQAAPGASSTAVLDVRQPLELIVGIHQKDHPDYPVTVISSQLTSSADVDSLAALIQQQRALGEHVVSLADCSGDAIAADLTTPGVTPSLTDLSLTLPAAQRYSYIESGNNSLRDTIIVTPDLAATTQIAYAHINAGSSPAALNDPTTPTGFSGHDPAIAYLALPLSGGGATLTPTSQNFPSTIVGQSSSAITFTFTNNSGANETVNSVVSSNVTEFPTQSSSTCPAIVPAGGTCIINVVFSPSATGARSSTLTVTSTDATFPTLTSSLTGTGLAATTTTSLTPSSATFPNTNIGNSSSGMQFVLTNTGNTAIGSISVGASGDYSATPSCGATLAPSATCNINVVFSPTAVGTRTGTLTVSSTSSNSPVTASLTGTGLSNTPGLTLSAYSLNFGNYEVGAGFGSSTQMVVYLTNNDSTTITFSGTSTSSGIAFPIAGDFGSNNNCMQTLASGASCRLNIAFTPATTGTLVGSLTVQSNASNGTQTLTLSGNGTAYSIATTTTSVTVQQGTTAVYSITLTPISGYTDTITLNCTGLAALGTSCSNPSATLGPAATVNFSVTTTAANFGGAVASGLAPRGTWDTRATWVIGTCSLLLLAFAGRTRRLARAAGLLALLLALLLPAGGCSGKQPTPNPDATPPGTYNFTLTSSDTAGGSHTLALTLVVTAQ